MTSDREELSGIAGETRRLLQEMKRRGIASVPAANGCPAPAQSDKRLLLEPIQRQALACTACKLCGGRKNVVFADGSPEAKLVFVGEGPGRDEDAQGLPFVGAAGQLLNKIIAAMKMTREEVYICNVVKCRPPNNRPPEPDEVAACMPFLRQQIAIIRPKVICALGKTAVSALLETEAPMSALRGRAFEWQGIPLVVTYHPAYLLRNPSAKKQVWEDMQQVLALLKG